MKKLVILASVLSMFLQIAKASDKDTTKVKKEVLKKTEIDVVYNHYIQDGNNSAVTGGIGTEKLIVYSPSVTYKRVQGRRGLSLKIGSDIISSASTDNIDFVKSSASVLDARTYSNLNVSSMSKSKRVNYGLGTGFSIESDYFSLPINGFISKVSKDKSREMGMEMQVFLDDLRWGRLNPGYYSPQYLIYPQELRGKDWFETTKRKSYTAKFSLSQIINKRNIIGVYPAFTVQSGLLATPFHRVFMNDSTTRVESLPEKRHKLALALKWNSFIGGRTIVKQDLSMYTDDFGIHSIAYEHEATFKLNSELGVSPFVRFYSQKGSRYFAAYKQHTVNDLYYTSDYDLSTLSSFKIGMGLKYAPFKQIGKHSLWNSVQLRYAYYKRSNGLYAHVMSCVLIFSHQKKLQK
ncbi:MAG: DUF3570 domain-containing protein [Bacteroidia bacterium]